MTKKPSTKVLVANITAAARESVSTGESFTTVADKFARLTGWLFAQCAAAFDGGVATADIAKAATDGGYKADDTTAGKLARAGRILLLDKPSHNADDVLARGDEARTTVNNAVRYGVSLADVDGLITAAPCTDEAIKSIKAAAKAAKDAKAAAKEAAAEAEKQQGEAAVVNAGDLLDASLKCLIKALTEGVITNAHIPALRAIAETAGAAAIMVEATEVEAEAEPVNA